MIRAWCCSCCDVVATLFLVVAVIYDVFVAGYNSYVAGILFYSNSIVVLVNMNPKEPL